MKRTLAVAAVVTLAALGGACGGNDKGTLDSSSTARTTAPAGAAPFDTSLVNGKPHFATPQEAMRFLADAWNRDDLVALKHVTDPSARGALENMHGVAINLRLNHCDKNPVGDYTCYFDHDYPPHPSTTMAMAHPGATGEAVFTVGPADVPGWYMTVFESCS